MKCPPPSGGWNFKAVTARWGQKHGSSRELNGVMAGLHRKMPKNGRVLHHVQLLHKWDIIKSHEISIEA